MKVLNSISFKKMLIDKLSYAQRKTDTFLAYLKNLLNENNGKINGAYFVLCLEKSIMNTLYLKSRLDLLEFLQENDKLGFIDSPRRTAVVYQGERKVWNTLQKSALMLPSYYAHAHMTDDYIYLKLHQIVDITASNNGISKSTSIFIKDAFLVTKNTYQQVSELICCHIQLLDDNEKQNFIYSDDTCSTDFTSEYDTFKQKIS
jgi:hypothetical protein